MQKGYLICTLLICAVLCSCGGKEGVKPPAGWPEKDLLLPKGVTGVMLEQENRGSMDTGGSSPDMYYLTFSSYREPMNVGSFVCTHLESRGWSKNSSSSGSTSSSLFRMYTSPDNRFEITIRESGSTNAQRQVPGPGSGAGLQGKQYNYQIILTRRVTEH